VPVLLSLKFLQKLYLAGTKLSPQSVVKLKRLSIQGL
jgi:hypothetical protein